MRVGILTFHYSRNYGAVMQAYALVKVLEKMGHHAEVVDYTCSQIQKDLKNSSKTKNVIKKCFYLKKILEFNNFNRKYLNLSKLEEKDIKNKLNEYDLLITGSDQVWNKKITSNDLVYFLKDIQQHKISYAASCGDNVDLNEDHISLLKSFDALSVRENILQSELESFGIECTTVCDPTILAGSDVFEKFSGSSLLSQKYVFVFMIWKSEELLKNATQFAESKGLRVISNKGSIKFLLHSRPRDFVSWIAHAEYVFTNSFHGSVFSLLFQKPFISSTVKPNGELNTRVSELLTLVGCESNILEDEKLQVKDIKPPNFNMVNAEMKKLQTKGMNFLTDVLDEIQREIL